MLGAGAILRLLMSFAWQPALFGWPDAASYIGVSQGELFSNELRPIGYPLFLRGLYAIAPSLNLVIALQHVLGLAAAAVLYCAVVRAGVSRRLALLPAALVSLGAGEVFLEHSPISETLFVFLLALALYAGVRSIGGESLRWPALAGLLLTAAATVRVVALPILVLGALWMLLATQAPLRRRLAMTGLAALGALMLLVPYYVAEYQAVGKTGLSRNGVWNIYGRVAPFADCRKFTPPRGTETLCESLPRARRPYTNQYTFNWYYSPAIRVFGDPHTATPTQTAGVRAFTWAVLVNQPLDYLEEVGAAMLRYVAPESFRGYGGGYSYHDLVHRQVLFNSTFNPAGREGAAEFYTDADGFEVDRGLIALLRTYESATRLQGPVFVLFALLSLAGPLLTRGPARSAGLLFALSAWVMLILPVATVEFSARTAVPAFGAFAAAAAVGAQGTLAALARRRRAPSAQQRPATTTSEPLSA